MALILGLLSLSFAQPAIAAEDTIAIEKTVIGEETITEAEDVSPATAGFEGVDAIAVETSPRLDAGEPAASLTTAGIVDEALTTAEIEAPMNLATDEAPSQEPDTDLENAIAPVLAAPEPPIEIVEKPVEDPANVLDNLGSPDNLGEDAPWLIDDFVEETVDAREQVPMDNSDNPFQAIWQTIKSLL